MESIAVQTASELGGDRSVLCRQKRDHVELDRLLHAIDASSGRGRQELLTQLCRLVFPHAFAEESVLWPAVRRILPDGEHLTVTIEREHQQINELFTQLETCDPDDAQHHQLWARIVELLREDVRDEEDELLPKLQAAQSRRQLIVLGLAWELARRIAPTRPHPVVARRPPGNVLAALPLTITDRLRDRLDRFARRTSGTKYRLLTTLSRGVAGIADRVEHLYPLTRGEDPSTHRTQQ
jgi:hemerythrin superfamily protein